MSDTNSDLVSDPVETPPEVSAPVEVAPEVRDPVEVAPEVRDPVDFAEVFAPEPVDQHADSGYRPVTGPEVQDYLRAKGMGLEGRPSKLEVAAFLASKA